MERCAEGAGAGNDQHRDCADESEDPALISSKQPPGKEAGKGNGDHRGDKIPGPYLHDGRARTLDDAIRAHDGEGSFSRTNYLNLTTDQKNLLIQFLNSL